MHKRIATLSATYKEFKNMTAGIEGYFTDLASSISDSILIMQRSTGIRGDCLEIGVLHGVSACLWALHLQPDEQLHLVDLEVRPALEQFLPKLRTRCQGSINLQKGSSFGVLSDSFITNAGRRIRLAHIDGDHSAWGIAVDLERVSRMMHPNGLIIVDDFLNDRFPQVTEETFKFLQAKGSLFQLVANGGNKAFIVSTKSYEVYYNYLLGALQQEIKKKGINSQMFESSSNNRKSISIRRA